MASRKYFISKDRLRQIIDNQDKLIKQLIEENDIQRFHMKMQFEIIEEQKKELAFYKAASSDINFPNTEKEGGFNS